jgi:hypothetical protein
MRDVSCLIDDQARRWKSTGEQQLDPTAHALTLALAGQLRKLADYAHGAAVTYQLPDLGEFLAEAVWHPRYGGPAAPHETGSFPAIE